jgi:hypothetical protein
MFQSRIQTDGDNPNLWTEMPSMTTKGTLSARPQCPAKTRFLRTSSEPTKKIGG